MADIFFYYMSDLTIMFIMSVITFALFAYDKHLAVYNCKRIPEFLLLALSFLAGAFGALCAMILFRHKTNHLKFTICVPVFLFLQLAFAVLVRVLFNFLGL